MPARTRESNRYHTMSQGQQVALLVEDKMIVSRYLCSQFWQLAKERVQREPEEDLICSICQESWLDCKTCAVMLVCGHPLHATCMLQLQDPQECPICRA